VVQTKSGLVAGRDLESGVRAWLGVPFAEPPVRERRWREAEPIRWAGTYNADRKMPACIQVLRPHDINHYFGEEATSEDCLYLNLWAPSDATPTSRLPVIVFLYGGGGTVGSAGMAPLPPSVKIADQDPATIGAYHTSEVPYYLGTQDAYNLFRPTRVWTAWDRELSHTLTAALVAFASTGNPSAGTVTWPAWKADDERYVEFGDTITVRSMDGARLDFMATHRPAPGPPGAAGARRFPRD
jgi:carboxylesterase type B